MVDGGRDGGMKREGFPSGRNSLERNELEPQPRIMKKELNQPPESKLRGGTTTKTKDLPRRNGE